MLEESHFFTPRNRRLAAYIVIACAAAFGLWRVESTADEAHDAAARAEATAIAFEEAEVRQDAEDCANRNQTKDALRGVINAAIGENRSSSGGGGSLDPSVIPGFADLDPEDQVFWMNVLRAISGGGDDGDNTNSTERLIAYRDSLVNEDCG